MKSSLLRWNMGALAAALLCSALAGCVAEGGVGYGGGVSVDTEVDTGADYYGPAGVVVGGWAPGYYVGPGRPGWDGHPHPGGPAGGGPGPHPMGGGTHAYRPAAAGHSAPSIPTAHRK